jgi:anti-sigma regulatory factor (Ser/Thr protein kinase)/ferredoxin
MTAEAFEIRGGDYDAGGAASRRLKRLLQDIGADPAAIRRAMVAAYEAEMNAVIHAGDAVMSAVLEPDALEVTVRDHGPGIPNVQRAMTEGYSTAPAAARELGFGAGMGLANIRKNTDRFTIRSAPGAGTQVRFTVQLGPIRAGDERALAPAIDLDRCNSCARCVPACPTGAMRCYGGTPRVLVRQCIGCNDCTAACPTGAIGGTNPMESSVEARVLLLPSPMAGQYACESGDIVAALRGAGAEAVHWTHGWEDALTEASRAHAAVASALPVLPPVCPAVVEWVRLRYPTLLPNIAPFLPPLEAAREDLDAEHLTVVPLCPAQAAVAGGPMTRVSMVAPQHVMAHLNGLPMPAAQRQREQGGRQGDTITGAAFVRQFLDALEAGEPCNARSVLLYACPGGCFGAPALPVAPAVAAARVARSSGALAAGHAAAVHRTAPLRARAGERLHENMARAIELLGRVDALVRELPGDDCGLCGAPTCGAFATDVVAGRAALHACPRRTACDADNTRVEGEQT